jgi:uncharacterized UBP type Zn finger protein
VLIHRGLSAYSGHYVAHIKDKKVYKQNLWSGSGYFISLPTMSG